MTKGISLTLVTMLLWALDLVFSRYAAIHLHANPVIFTCLALLVASTVLIIIAGPGRGGLDTVRKPHTWAYGVCQVLMNITQMSALLYISTTEVSLLSRFNIILGLLAAWMFLDRSPKRTDYLGVAVILAGLGWIVHSIQTPFLLVGLFWIFWGCMFNTARTAIAETHPTSNVAQSVKERCRVTGYVLLITSCLLLFVTFGAAWVKTMLPPIMTGGSIPLFSGMPTLGDFTHHGTMFSAMLLGATVLPAGMYFYFYAAKTVKSENFLILLAFHPFLIFIVEWLASLGGWLSIHAIQPQELAAGAVVVGAALFMIYTRHRTSLRQRT